MLRGFICPKENGGKKVSFGECFRCDSWSCMPRIFRLGIILKNQARPDEITASMICSQCMRKVVFEKLFPYWRAPQTAYYAARGNWIHDAVESSARADFEDDTELGKLVREFTDDLIIEQRYRVNLDGETISGQIDMYEKSTKTLVDFKSFKSSYNGVPAVVRESRARETHVQQVQIYKYLLEKNNVPVENIKIAYITLGGVYVTGEAYAFTKTRKGETITEEYSLEPIAVMPNEEIEEYIRPRLKQLKEGFEKKDPMILPVIEKGSEWLCRFCEFTGCEKNPEYKK